MFFLATLSRSVNICWRTNETLSHCEIPFVKEISDEAGLTEFSDENLVIDLHSSMQYPAYIEKYNRGFKNVTIVGHDSYLSLDISNFESLNDMRIHNVNLVISGTKNDVFNYIELKNCNISEKGISLQGNSIAIDSVSASGFSEINVNKKIALDASDLGPSAANGISLKLVNTTGKCSIDNIPDGTHISSDSQGITVLGSGTIKILNPSKWSTELSLGKSATVAFDEPSKEMAQLIQINMNEGSNLNLAKYDKSGDINSKVVFSGVTASISFDTNSKVDMTIENNARALCKGDSSAIGSLQVNEAMLIFENGESSQNTKSYIDRMLMKGISLITSQKEMDLETKLINIENAGINGYIIDRFIDIYGTPSIMIKNSNCRFGTLHTSHLQRIHVITDLKHNGGIAIDGLVPRVPIFDISLSFDGIKADSSIIEGLVGKPIKLITIPAKFSPSQTFSVVSEIDGFTPDSSVISKFIDSDASSSTVGYKFTTTPMKGTLQVCVKGTKECPSDQRIRVLNRFEDIKSLINKEIKHVRIFVQEEKRIELNDIDSNVNVTVQGCNDYSSVVHFKCTQNVNKFIDRLVFEDIIADFENGGASELAVNAVAFTSQSDMTTDSQKNVKFADKTKVELTVSNYGKEAFSKIVNPFLFVNDDIAVSFNQNTWTVEDSESSLTIDHSKNLKILVDAGNQITVNNNASSTKCIDIYGTFVEIHFLETRRDQTPIINSYINGIINVVDGEYIPISFAEGETSIILNNNKDAVFCPMNLKNCNIHLYQQTENSASISFVKFAGNCVFTAEPLTDASKFALISEVQVEEASNTSISNCIINGKTSVSSSAILKLDGDSFKGASIHGVLSIGEKVPGKLIFANLKEKPTSISYSFDGSLKNYCSTKKGGFSVQYEIIKTTEDLLDVLSFGKVDEPDGFSISISKKKLEEGIEVSIDGKITQGGERKTFVYIMISLISLVTITFIIVYYCRKTKYSKNIDKDYLIKTDDVEQLV